MASPLPALCTLRRPRCPNYQDAVTAWERQAAYTDWALASLPARHPVRAAAAADDAARAVAGAGAAAPRAGAVALPLGSAHRFVCGGWDFEIDARVGEAGRGGRHSLPAARAPGRAWQLALPTAARAARRPAPAPPRCAAPQAA